MPKIGKPLQASEIAKLRRWIEDGAKMPARVESNTHWSYVAPTRPPLAKVRDSAWPKSEIDYFVLAQAEALGYQPAAEAPRTTLIRRLYLDLIGLPPSPAEVDRFNADHSSTAYEKLVDELLSRDQFGEHWARSWLDLARYADSHGFQRDDLREIWAYRDWVIKALNADMPFDQFTIEQIAGDLLPNATESQRIATGFHRCTPTNVEAGSIPEETRIEQVIDRVNTTGAVWLGSTLECCQCHDHKYDPFTSKDYYRLLAYFNNTELEADLRDPKVPSSIAFRGPSMPIADPSRDSQRRALEQQRDEVKQRLEARKGEFANDFDEWENHFAKSIGTKSIEFPLDVQDFDTQGTTDTYKLLDDKSVLLVGNDPPSTDIYTITIHLRQTDIRALKLDVLTHSTLPGEGPGRGDIARPNFVLHEFTAAVRPLGSNSAAEQLAFSAAQADFAQRGFEPAGLIDGLPKTGWAISPKFNQPHWAKLILLQPLDASQGIELTIKLDQQLGNARTIGRFRLSAITGDVQASSLPAQVELIMNKKSKERSQAEVAQLIAYRASNDAVCRAMDQQIGEFESKIKQVASDQTLVMIERNQPRVSTMFVRGDYRQPGEKVEPGTPQFLHPQSSEPAARTTLAKWLVDPANPLVARVVVNRWWAELFGTGIVSTVEDFGIKGELPTHPELLDWLAVEFVESGWSMKHILKKIVTSATYCQSSNTTSKMLELDDQNRLLLRGARFRMSAEMIRDNALAISGLLSLEQFGPPIRPYQPDGFWNKVGGERYDYIVSPGSQQDRRGIYVVLKRGAAYPSFMNFDASSRLACTVQRSRTNTPLQALDLLNDPIYVRAAQALAKRIVRDRPDGSTDDRVQYAFRLCTARPPSSDEAEVLRSLFKRQLEANRIESSAAKPNSNTIDSQTKVDAHENAAWYSVATTLLNLHETITRD